MIATTTMKREVTLQFPTFEALWAFNVTIHSPFFELNPRKKMLFCECTDEQLNLALTRYHATRVNSMGNSSKRA
jgi:hypothetical protein